MHVYSQDMNSLTSLLQRERGLLVPPRVLLNAARQAGASPASPEVTVKDGQVTIVVADNGHGPGFKGRYDHGLLPRSTLRERAALLAAAPLPWTRPSADTAVPRHHKAREFGPAILSSLTAAAACVWP
jgi:hypothetical protein